MLIIGGTRGIGNTIAQSFARQGHVVSVIGRKKPTEAHQEYKNIHYWFTDVASEKHCIPTVTDIVKKNGRISHCIFCQRFRGAGDSWNGEVAVSLTATKKIIDAVSDCFDDSPEKSIVIITSLASIFMGLEQPLSYHVCKAGLLGLIRYYAVTLGPKGIRVNGVSPMTILKDESKQFYLTNRRLYALYKRIIPLGRMGTAEDIAGIVEFLCSSASAFITGQSIVADGGLSLQSQEALARNEAALAHPNYGKK